MNDKIKRALRFAIIYIIILGSFVLILTALNYNGGYDLVGTAIFLLIIYTIIGVWCYFIFRNKSRPVSQGLIWGVISIFIFLFIIGGCGVFR